MITIPIKIKVTVEVNGQEQEISTEYEPEVSLLERAKKAPKTRTRHMLLKPGYLDATKGPHGSKSSMITNQEKKQYAMRFHATKDEFEREAIVQEVLKRTNLSKSSVVTYLSRLGTSGNNSWINL